MTDMHFEDGTLVVEKELSELDEFAFEFFDILDDEGIEFVIVSGYLLLLTGRTRMTEDIDLLLSISSDSELESVATRLEREGYVATPPPIEKLPEFLQRGHVNVAKEGQFVPSFDLTLPETTIEHAAVDDPMQVRVGGRTVQACPIEQQIAYKLYLAGDPREWKGTDFEDAVHLYHVFQDHIDMDTLESYVREVDAEVALDELERT